MCANLFIMLVSNGEQYINIVKIEDLARLMAGGDVFATHKKIRGRGWVFWVGIAVMCVVGKIETLLWHSAFPELRVWYSRRGFVRTKKIVKK